MIAQIATGVRSEAYRKTQDYVAEHGVWESREVADTVTADVLLPLMEKLGVLDPTTKIEYAEVRKVTVA